MLKAKQDAIIDPKKLIEELGVEGLNHYSDEYYKRMDDSDIHIGKPYSYVQFAAQYLVSLGLILENFRVRPGIDVLDFGAGTCWISKILWQMGCNVIATDVSKEALRMGEKLFKEFPVPAPPNSKWETRLFDGHILPVEDERIDRIISFDAFHHVPNAEVVIKEFYRVLRDGGTVALCEPVGEHSVSEMSQQEMRNFSVLENDLDVGEMATQFRSAGFSGPLFKLSAVQGATFSIEERQDLLDGGMPELVSESLRGQARNSGIMFFQKGEIHEDSRLAVPEGMQYEMSISESKLQLKVGEPKSLYARLRNTGTHRWLNKNEGTYGEVAVGTQLLDHTTREVVEQHGRFHFSRPLNPNDEYEMHLPIVINQPGRFIIRFDVVSELVCWFRDFGSKPCHVEVEVSE